MSWFSKSLGNIVGSVAGGLLAGHSARDNAAYQAQLQLDNWKYMQSNAHQLEVEDLKAAGLNPILSATGGQIAGTSQVSVHDPSNYSSLISSALRMDLEGKKLDNDKKRLELNAMETNARVNKSNAEIKLLENQTVESAWKSHYIDAQTNLLKRELFERIDLYDLTMSLKEATASEAWARVGRVGAEIQELGSRSGLNVARTALLEKEYKFGAFLSKYLPLAFSKDFEDNPTGALIRWKDSISDVVFGKKDIPEDVKSVAEDVFDYIKNHYVGAD